MRQYDAAGNLLEFIRQPLYDSADISNTPVEFRYFATPQGQGTPIKTLFSTNMDTAGQLSVPKSQLIDGFRFVPTAIMPDADQLTFLREILYNQTYFRFTVGGLKDYLQVPLWYLPSGFGLPGYADQGGVTAAPVIQQASNGSPIFGNYFSIRSHPILIPSQQTFGATIETDSALAALTTPVKTWVVLEGVNGRETM